MIWSRSQAPERPPIDWDLNERLFGGQREMGERFLRRFIELNTDTMEELRAAHAALDREAIRALAHKIKGGSGSVGAVGLNESAAALEIAAGSPTPWEEVEAALALVAKDWETLRHHGD